jgi:hypothetical protein
MNWQAIIASSGILGIYLTAKRWFAEINKILDPLVQECEQLAQDGVIDKNDRKKLVLSAVANLEKQGKVKLNFITRLIVVKVVDIIAAKLPDYNISKEARELLIGKKD